MPVPNVFIDSNILIYLLSANVRKAIRLRLLCGQEGESVYKC
jgi:predicted nucleic acid-binding protein